MARAVKKQKSAKNKKKITLIALSSVLGVAIIAGIVILLIVLLQPKPKSQFADERSMSYETLTEILDQEVTGNYEDYENKFYVYVFSSDYKTYANHEHNDETLVELNQIFKNSKELRATYEDKNVPNDQRVGFYVLDLYDEKNEEMLEAETYKELIANGPFIIEVENTKADLDEIIQKDFLNQFKAIAQELLKEKDSL